MDEFFELGTAANAADIYLPGSAGPGGYKDDYIPLPTWTGFYVGANAGYGWGTAKNDWSMFATNAQIAGTQCPPAFCASGSDTHSM